MFSYTYKNVSNDVRSKSVKSSIYCVIKCAAFHRRQTDMLCIMVQTFIVFTTASWQFVVTLFLLQQKAAIIKK
jgi:3-deoxy-D-manno-octulosonic acid (KDO) 8-phosphate synthase